MDSFKLINYFYVQNIVYRAKEMNINEAFLTSGGDRVFIVLVLC